MKADDHVRVTEAAVDLYRQVYGTPVSRLLQEQVCSVKKGVEDADKKPIAVRATNWHFYNRNLAEHVIEKQIWEFQEPTLFHLSSDHILRKRDEELSEEIQKGSIEDACVLVGRVLHHIQDMSTPSHVVPVYHGVLVKDSFETYLHEDYLHEEQNIASLKAGALKELSVDSDPVERGVMELYVDAAENTLMLLTDRNQTLRVHVDGVEQPLLWTYFWEPKNVSNSGSYDPDCPFAGFGNFGPLGKHFGDEEAFTRRGVTYRINQSDCDALCYELMKKVILDSLVLFRALEKRLMPLTGAGESEI